MARINPLATASAVFLLCLIGLVSGRRGAASAPAMAGVLYTASADTAPVVSMENPVLPPLPQLAVSVPAAQRAAFPDGTSAVVRFVPLSQSSYTLTVALKARPRPAKPAIIKPAAPVAAESVPPPPPAPPAAATKPPPSAQPETFEDYDDALRRSPTTQAVNARLARDGVTFRLTHAGAVGGEAVVLYAVANSGNGDFFLSVLNVFADGAPVPSGTAGGYACRGGREIFGAVHFAAGAVAGKTVAVELVESGGGRRRFLLKVDHAF